MKLFFIFVVNLITVLNGQLLPGQYFAAAPSFSQKSLPTIPTAPESWIPGPFPSSSPVPAPPAPLPSYLAPPPPPASVPGPIPPPQVPVASRPLVPVPPPPPPAVAPAAPIAAAPAAIPAPTPPSPLPAVTLNIPFHVFAALLQIPGFAPLLAPQPTVPAPIAPAPKPVPPPAPLPAYLCAAKPCVEPVAPVPQPPVSAYPVPTGGPITVTAPIAIAAGAPPNTVAIQVQPGAKPQPVYAPFSQSFIYGSKRSHKSFRHYLNKNEERKHLNNSDE